MLVPGQAARAEPGVLVGVVESIAGEAVALRLAESVVLLKISGRQPKDAIERAVSVRLCQLVAWPTGI